MIKCNQLSFHYEYSNQGIEDIDFSTEKGLVVGVIGENGAGKSTLFKCLLGLHKPQRGEVRVDGVKIDYSKSGLIGHRQKVNMVLQDPERQLFHTSIYDDVSMGPKNLGLPKDIVKERTERCIKLVAADAFEATPIQYLSYGQKKRVAIAGILALECETILLDEPETGLDPKMKKEMVTLIKRLAMEGRSVVVSSHNMDLIYELCDQVYVMHQGRIIANGKTHDIMSQQEVMHQASLERPLMIRVSEKFGIDSKLLLEGL